MEKIINKLINEFTQGVDTYTHNNSTWLIFTETKQWIIELTDNKTLWYNYNFFKGIFAYTSLEVVENQKYITKWVEDNIINKELTYVTLFRDARDRKQQFEDTLENGVRHTEDMITNLFVEDTIENGVKYTKMAHMKTDWSVDDTIENGVKETKHKNTRLILDTSGRELILESHLVIRDGVKETNYDTDNYTDDVKEVISEGVKETSHRQYLKTYDVKDTIQDETEHDRWILDGCDDPVDEVLDNGVKNSVPLQYIPKEIIDNVVESGVKETHDVDWTVGESVIDDVLENGIVSTYDDEYHHKGRIEGVIKNGVKETTPLNPSFSFRYINGDMKKIPNVEEIIKNGVKETLIWDDSIVGEQNQYGYVDKIIDTGIKEVVSYDENKRGPVNQFGYIDDIIDNGVKETVAAGYTDPKTNILYVKWGTQIDDVIDNGVKETNAGKRDWTITTNDVILKGVKETKSDDFNLGQSMVDKVIDEGIKTKNPTD